MANDVVKPVYGSFVPVLEGEKLTMRILVIYHIPKNKLTNHFIRKIKN